MANAAFFYQDVISGAKVSPRDLRWARCHGTSFVLVRNQVSAYIETVENSKKVETTGLSSTPDAFDLERIDCIRCMRSFLVEDPEVYNLKIQNSQLKSDVDRLKRLLNRDTRVSNLN